MRFATLTRFSDEFGVLSIPEGDAFFCRPVLPVGSYRLEPTQDYENQTDTHEIVGLGERTLVGVGFELGMSLGFLRSIPSGRRIALLRPRPALDRWMAWAGRDVIKLVSL